jgi:DNA-binding GntR family transcriptional regulator
LDFVIPNDQIDCFLYDNYLSSIMDRDLVNVGDASAPADVVTPAPLRRRVEDALRLAITSGQFAPGDRLRERQLMESLKVSRTSLREALRQIEAEGLVALEPNRGSVVTRVSYEEAEEIYEVRSVLEAQACSGFAKCGSYAQMAQLRVLFEKMTAAADAGDVWETLEIKSRLYQIIFEGCGNRLIRQMLSQLHNRAMLLRRMSLSEPTRLQEMLREIARLLEAFAAHDASAAHTISVHHINQAKRAALKVMRSELEQASSRHRRNGADAPPPRAGSVIPDATAKSRKAANKH